MNKPFKTGLIIGRFQPLHNGHAQMIDLGMELCDLLIIAVGSADKSGTSTDPLDYDARVNLLEEYLHNKQPAIDVKSVGILALNDQGLGNTPKWGDYVIQVLKRQYKLPIPDLLISAQATERSTWFDHYPEIARLTVPRYQGLSATQMRDLIRADNYMAWSEYTPRCLWNYYEAIKERCGDDEI